MEGAPDEDVPFEVIRIGQALPLFGNGSQTLHTLHPRMFGKLKRLFHEPRFDIIHSHAPYNPSIVQVPAFVAPPESVTIGTFHSVFSGNLLFDVLSPLMRPSIARLDGRIVVSEPCIQSLMPYFPFEYTVIPNGIDNARFTPEAQPFPEFLDGRKNILFLGRFDPRNGLGTMIDTFTAVRRARGSDVIWEHWQETLEPLREALNTALSERWEEWEIPQNTRGSPDTQTHPPLLRQHSNADCWGG